GRPGGELAATRPAVAGDETVGDVYLLDRAAATIACAGCGTVLGALGDDPKAGMAMVEHPLAELAGDRADLHQFVDDDIVWREWCCPGCGVRLANEVGYPGEPAFAEIRIDR